MPGTIEGSGLPMYLCSNLVPGMIIQAVMICAHCAGNKYLLGSQKAQVAVASTYHQPKSLSLQKRRHRQVAAAEQP